MSLLARLELHPSRKLGQNFLVDENCLEALVRVANPVAGERVLEIGPGAGALTERLLAAGCQVTAIEFDRRLHDYLAEHFADIPGLRLLQADACRVDYNALFPQESGTFRCIANLPYSCASVLLAKLATLANPPSELHVLLQREMAERLIALPGSDAYGALTVRIAFRYQAKIARMVPAGVFFPQPEVDSAFVSLVRRPEVPAEPLLDKADSLVNAAFAQRRKQARKLLERFFPNGLFPQLLTAHGFAPEARAEEFSPQDFLAFAKEVSKSNGYPD